MTFSIDGALTYRSGLGGKLVLMAPIVNAGSDQIAHDSDNNGSASVTLDGSGSTDRDGVLVSYSWIENGVEVATGMQPQVNLAVGSHTIILRVTDNDGATGGDVVTIIVEPPAQDAAGNGNLASTGTDNEVSYEPTTSPMTSVFDDDILDQTACNFPCWHGLTPGITTESEIQNFLTTDLFVLQSATVFSQTVGDELEYIWIYEHGESILASKLIVKNNILHSIYIDPAIDYSLDQILNIYGDPAGFTYYYNIHRETAVFIINLYYPSNGLIINFTLYEGPPQINYFLTGNAVGMDFVVLPAQNTLVDLFAYYLELDPVIAADQIDTFFVEGWPGLNSRIGEPIAASLGQPARIPVIVSPTPDAAATP